MFLVCCGCTKKDESTNLKQQEGSVEALKTSKSIDEQAKEDFDLVLKGKKPVNAIFDEEHGLPADGGTTFYKGNGYKLEIKQTMTEDDKKTDGFLYGPIITFDDSKTKTLSDVKFYTVQDLKKLKGEK